MTATAVQSTPITLSGSTEIVTEFFGAYLSQRCPGDRG
jgi:hypothetical protein